MTTILKVHNYCQEKNLSGENVCYEADAALLERRGHRVVRYLRHSDEIDTYTSWRKAALARDVVWSRRTVRALRELIASSRPAVAHLHNTFPLISPAAYQACREAGLPVVQSVYNYRLICPNAVLFRDGGVCHECPGKTLPWPGIRHGCYRGSRTASAVVAAMLAAHRLRGTWSRQVDLYVVNSEFARRQLVAGGLPADRIVVRPCFVEPDLGPGRHAGGYVLFVGHLVAGKGIGTLLRAWERLGGRIPLRIVGDGPLDPEVARAAERLPGVTWLGRLPRVEGVYELMGDAAVVLFPSEWYETFGRVVIEAFARGTPVIASRHGPVEEIVEDGDTGLLFRPADPEDLAAKVEYAWTHPDELAAMGRRARREYEDKYTAARSYRQLTEIYDLALRRTRP